MKFIELQKYGRCSVVVRQDEKGNPIVINPFVVAFEVNKQDGEIIDWAFGHYFDDLFNATDYARVSGKRMDDIQAIQFCRLEEIASKTIDGLIQDDEETAYEYFASEVEMDSHEAEYFGLDKEKLEEYIF